MKNRSHWITKSVTRMHASERGRARPQPSRRGGRRQLYPIFKSKCDMVTVIFGQNKCDIRIQHG